MKFVASRDILNVPALGLVLNEKTPNFVNSNHVPTGHRFNIGTADTFKQCTDSERKTITALIASESVIADSPSNAPAIAKIDAEVKAKAARKAAAAKPGTP